MLITFFQTITQAGLVSFNSKWLLVAFVPIAFIFYMLARYFRNSSRELQRLTSISSTPIFSAFTEALQGAITIQATGAQPRFLAAHLKRVNHNMRADFHLTVCGMWLSVRLESLCTLVIGLTAVLAVYEADNGTTSPQAAAYAGLALSAAPALTEMLNALLKTFTSLETGMVAVERVSAYANLPPEEKADPTPPPQSWPDAGALEFRDVIMGYRPELPAVLRRCSFSIKAGQSVGICGRTGSGKVGASQHSHAQHSHARPALPLCPPLSRTLTLPHRSPRARSRPSSSPSSGW